MTIKHLLITIAGTGLVLGQADWAKTMERNGYRLSVVVDGTARPEYRGRGTTYVEALRGQEYTLRLTNPFPRRAAVALSVDGLNTIDARRTSPEKARKWVLDPYETIEIEGWQVNDDQARSFYFTGERDSYGAWLGKTRNLGVIEAVFFKERRPIPLAYASGDEGPAASPPDRGYLDRGRRRGPRAAGKAEEERPSGEYAATGIGERTDHRVHLVHLDLESQPAAVLSIRYEFRPALVRLGILPRPPQHTHGPLGRRETARGFDDPYCPDPHD
jgi:hypothetical protein